MHDPIRFILAGNALFTVENTTTGNRFTFKVRQPDDTKPHFVSVLTGPNNESDYAFLGTVFTPERYHHGRRSRIAQDAPSAKARPSVRRAAGGEERSGEAGGIASRPTRTAMGEGKEVLFMAFLSEC